MHGSLLPHLPVLQVWLPAYMDESPLELLQRDRCFHALSIGPTCQPPSPFLIIAEEQVPFIYTMDAFTFHLIKSGSLVSLLYWFIQGQPKLDLLSLNPLQTWLGLWLSLLKSHSSYRSQAHKGHINNIHHRRKAIYAYADLHSSTDGPADQLA